MRKRKVKIPLYHGELTILQVKNMKDISKMYNLDTLHGFDACMFRNPDKNGYSKYVLAFENKTTHNIIAHECMHFVNNVFEDRGISPDVENDEPQAYLLGWVVEQCYKIVKTK